MQDHDIIESKQYTLAMEDCKNFKPIPHAEIVAQGIETLIGLWKDLEGELIPFDVIRKWERMQEDLLYIRDGLRRPDD